jgi:hypothetical protein
VGPILFVLITFVGVRMLSYWRSFVFHSARYRQRVPVSTEELPHLEVPFVKVQITTRGSAGSTEVILRGIRNVQLLAAEDPELYGRLLSVELVTESELHAAHLERVFAGYTSGGGGARDAGRGNHHHSPAHHLHQRQHFPDHWRCPVRSVRSRVHRGDLGTDRERVDPGGHCLR